MKLIAYLSNGYPTLEESNARGKFFVELWRGHPRSRFPRARSYLDSNTCKGVFFAALKNESNYDVYMDALIKLQEEVPSVEYLVNIYEYTVREIGVDKFVSFMRKIKQTRYC